MLSSLIISPLGEFGSDPEKINPYAASTFYAVDRYAGFARGWKDFYDKGGLIVCDRYTTSNAVHQGSKLQGEKQAEFYLTPEKTETGYRLGISVRDNISGIGTITFFDPETGVYGALGHGVAGLTSAQPLAISGGVLVPSTVTDVKKGVRGTPGELHGSFDVADPLGSVSQNEPHGIFGKLTALPQSESVPVADASQIHTGAAVILANVDGKETREYCVRIDKLYPQAENGRNLLLTVTDERLLSITGGIVQGMSGSPILQDGKLIGAVTHVLVNRPEQGYGIFLQNMLAQCEAYQ